MNSVLHKSQLLERHMVPVGARSSQKHIIRVLQWNLLAQGLSQDNFITCPMEALEWSVRSKKIINELVAHNPDILCLEEVDMFPFLKKILSPLGYTGHFFPKPNSPCLQSSHNIGPDGCAIFHKASRFNVISQVNLNLEVDNTISNQVAILKTFKTTDSNTSSVTFSVLVTHLKAKEDMSEIRLKQGQFIVRHLKQHMSTSRNVIMCGDFNAEPTEDVYKFIKSSDLNFTSAYTKLGLGGSEPKYTSWKTRASGKAQHTIDYIWLAGDSTEVTALLSIPTEQEVGIGGLPSWNYPSDHFALIADVAIK